MLLVGSNANNQSHESCQKAIISDTAQQYYNVGDLAIALVKIDPCSSCANVKREIA